MLVAAKPSISRSPLRRLCDTLEQATGVPPGWAWWPSALYPAWEESRDAWAPVLFRGA